jgi:cytochrome c oxidase assembly protein subunit 15
MLGWLAFAGVQIQGLLGGLRVVLFKDEIGVFHATLAQMFFVLLCAILLLSSRWWQGKVASGEWRGAKGQATGVGLTWLLAGTTALILGQLILGAMMRHQHAGLAIPDFPLAYGKIWPAMDPGSVELYNQRRLEVVAVKPITAFQIGLQMTHRITALLILGAVAACAWLSPRTLGATQPLGKWSLAWLALVLAQAALGAATVLTDKAADVATGHVLLGALSLAAGSLLSIVVWKETIVLRNEVKLSEPVFGGEPSVAAGLRRMHAAR